MAQNKINALDLSIVVFYFIGVIVTGFWAMCRSNRSTVKGYFLAGQSMIWLPIGASLFASNIGSEHFIGLAGSGAAKGIGVGAFELNASILLQLLGWVFLPVYISSGADTLPAYMKKRFGGRRIQVYLAVISLLMYIFTKISVNLYSASLFIYEALQWNLWISVGILLVMTALITVTGGLAAVIYTDTLQCFLMILGSILLTILSFIKVGGISGLFSRYGHSVASVPSLAVRDSVLNNSRLMSCYMPSKKAFQLLRPVDDPDMPWLGFLFGQTPASIWYWCTDQMMVQRALAAQNIVHAKGGTLFAGILKLLPLFIMVMPGMISRILFTDEVACATIKDCIRVCNQPTGCTNIAYPKLVMNLLPQGVRGLMLSVMLAALITDLTSIFNSASTLFTVDIYSVLKPKTVERELIVVGKVFVLVMVGLSLLWLPVIQNMQGGQLFIYIQAVSGYLSPPIAAVYLVAIFWPRANEKGAITSLLYGLIIGVSKMISDVVFPEQPCELEDIRPLFIRNWHYMYFALFSFLSCIGLLVVVSLATGSSSNESGSSSSTTFWSYRRLVCDNRHRPAETSVGEEIQFKIVGPEETDIQENGDEKMLQQPQPQPQPNQINSAFAKSNNHLDPKENRANRPHVRDRLMALLKGYWRVFLGSSNVVEGVEQSAAMKLLQSELDIRRWLYEGRNTRIILNVFMSMIVTSVVTLYVVFSASFSEIEIGSIPVVPRNWSLSDNVTANGGV